MLKPTTELSRRELFALGEEFTIRVDDTTLEGEVRFDILDPEDLWAWLPRLGPSATLMYINVLRYWPHRDLRLGSITLSLRDMANDIGIGFDVAQRNWHRLHSFRIFDVVIDPDRVLAEATFTRWLPEHHTIQLDRMTPAWNVWYRELHRYRCTEQGLTH